MEKESYCSAIFFYQVLAGTDLERVLSADYFRACAPGLISTNNRIIVRFDAPRMGAELLVLEVDALAGIHA